MMNKAVIDMLINLGVEPENIMLDDFGGLINSLNRLTVSKLIAFVIGFICIFFAYNYNKSATYKISGPIYGTYWQLVSTEYITDSLKKSIEDELSRIDLIASNYKEDSELSTINSASLNQKILISSDMYSLLSFAENLFEITNGYYDVTLGSLVIENGFGPENTMVENTIPVSIKKDLICYQIMPLLKMIIFNLIYPLLQRVTL